MFVSECTMIMFTPSRQKQYDIFFLCTKILRYQIKLAVSAAEITKMSIYIMHSTRLANLIVH